MGKYWKVEEKLIAEIQKYPALWNTKDSNYKFKTVRENAWQAVTDCVNMETNSGYTVIEYRDRIWKNIRDAYVRVLGGTGKKSGSGVDEVPKYPYLQAMSFLKPYVNIKTKNIESNFQPIQLPIPDQNNPNENSSSELASDSQIECTGISSQQMVPVVPKILSGEMNDMISKKPDNKRSNASISQKQMDRVVDVKILEYISGAGKRSKETQDKTHNDSEEAFGKSVPAQLRLLDQKAKAISMGNLDLGQKISDGF